MPVDPVRGGRTGDEEQIAGAPGRQPRAARHRAGRDRRRSRALTGARDGHTVRRGRRLVVQFAQEGFEVFRFVHGSPTVVTATGAVGRQSLHASGPGSPRTPGRRERVSTRSRHALRLHIPQPDPRPASIAMLAQTVTRYAFVTTAGAALVIGFTVQLARVEGQSMAPTLANQDRLVVDRLTYRIGNPTPGDIVMFHVPVAPDPPVREAHHRGRGRHRPHPQRPGHGQRPGAGRPLRAGGLPQPRGLGSVHRCRPTTTS